VRLSQDRSRHPASELLIPRGRQDLRPPGIISAAAARSVPVRPSAKQKRKNARSALTKTCAEAADTTAGSASTAPVTMAGVSAPTSPPGA
jgi:hypothetical protein